MKTQVEMNLSVTNHRSMQVQFVVEPWGDAYPMNPQETFKIVFTSDVPGEPEVDAEDDAIIVFAWTGCDIVVYKSDGTILRS